MGGGIGGKHSFVARFGMHSPNILEESTGLDYFELGQVRRYVGR